jgi:hypothetical protein
VAIDVPRGEHLFSQEVATFVTTCDGHALVVRSEDGAVVQAEDRLVDDGERDREQPIAEGDEEEQIEREMERHEACLQEALWRFGDGEVLDAHTPHAEGLEEEEKRQHDGLNRDDGALPAGALLDLIGGEDDEGDIEVGIFIDVVGVCVVRVVLHGPPGMAKPEQHIADEQAEDLVRAAAAEGLPVDDVVRQQPGLGRRDCENDSASEHERRVGNKKGESYGPSDHREDAEELKDVVGGLGLKEALGADDAPEVSVFGRMGACWGQGQRKTSAGQGFRALRRQLGKWGVSY